MKDQGSNALEAGGASAARPHCRNCGQGLGERGEQECCPECGLPVIVSVGTAAGAVAIDVHGVVVGDTTCHKCGYNLRGLKRDGRCPECATPVSVSVQHDLLCFAEPGYIRTLARGNVWILRGMAVAVLSFIGGLGLAFVTSVLDVGSALAGVLRLVAELVLVVGPLGGGLLFLAGVWRVTVAQPGVYGAARRDTARRLVRVCLLTSLLGRALNEIVGALAPPMGVFAVYRIFALSFLVLGVIGVSAYFLYMRGIVRRIPDAQSADRARVLARNLAIVFGILVLCHAITTVARWGPVVINPAGPAPATAPSVFASAPAGPGGPSNWWAVRTCVSGVAFLAALVYLSRAERLLRALRKPLKQQAEFAAQHWRAATDTG